MKADTPTHVADISELSDDELEGLIEGIRERRLRPIAIYETLLAEKSGKKIDKIMIKVDKQLELFKKDLIKADAAVIKLEGRKRMLEVLRMEIELL
jgi:hypothetical protein